MADKKEEPKKQEPKEKTEGEKKLDKIDHLRRD